MNDFTGVILGGVIGVAGVLLKDYWTRTWDKEKWLLDHEAKECAECIDLLWASRPSETKEDLKARGWKSGDFYGRMDALRHVPAKMASLMLYQAHRGESIVNFEESRGRLVEQIDKVRAEPDRDEGGNTVKTPHELPQAIDAALQTVEDYLRTLKGSDVSTRTDAWTTVEKQFLFFALATHAASFLYVYLHSAKWGEYPFIFAYVACLLLFGQFIIRYIAITNQFKTQTTIWSWILSLAIVAISNLSTLETPNGSTWFLFVGLLLILAPMKTQMSRNRIRQSGQSNAERLMRLQEYMVFEGGFGCFMLFMYSLSRFGVHSNADALTFFGSLFALYYALVSTVVNGVRMVRGRHVFEQRVREQS